MGIARHNYLMVAMVLCKFDTRIGFVHKRDDYATF